MLRKPWRAGLVVAALILVSYLPVWSAGFIMDDDDLLTGNPLVSSLRGIGFIWAHSYYDYFPLTLTSFWIEWRLWGASPLGYHITNVLLHMLGVAMIWRVLERLDVRGAWLAACLFAVHPLNAASVAWISERKNVLSLPFYVGAVLLFLRAEDQAVAARPWKRLYGSSLASYVLGLLAKTSGVMLPVVLLGCAWWRRGKVGRQDMLRALPFFLLSLAFGIATVWLQFFVTMTGVPVRGEGFLGRVATAGWALWFYLGKTLVPVNLAVFYHRWELPVVTVAALLPTVGIIVIFAAAWRWRTSSSWGRPVLFALGYFVVMLAPVLGFVDSSLMRYSLVADHWMYLPLIGLLALAAAALVSLRDRLRAAGAPAPVLTAAAALLVLTFAGLTGARARVYASQEALWTDTIEKDPASWSGHNGLGHVLYQAGKNQEAREHFLEALRLHPDYAEALNNYGSTLAFENRHEEAIAAYEKALALLPRYLDAHKNLGNQLVQVKRFAEAEKHFQAALRISELDTWTLLSYADLLRGLKRYDEALGYSHRAFQLGNQENSHLLAALIFIDQDKLEPAKGHLIQILKRNPGHARAILAMGVISEKGGDLKEAALAFSQAIRLNPGLTEAQEHLKALLDKGALSSEAIIQSLGGRGAPDWAAPP